MFTAYYIIAIVLLTALYLVSNSNKNKLKKQLLEKTDFIAAISNENNLLHQDKSELQAVIKNLEVKYRTSQAVNENLRGVIDRMKKGARDIDQLIDTLGKEGFTVPAETITSEMMQDWDNRKKPIKIKT